MALGADDVYVITAGPDADAGVSGRARAGSL
jgi:hypothetical protein